MQEESIITIVIFLIGQTIAIWQKLSKIEQKIDVIQRHNDEQDEKIRKIIKVIGNRINGAAKELIS